MKVRKALITAAAATQRALPLQTVVDQDGIEKPVLRVLAEEAWDAGVEEICVVVYPGDETLYATAASPHKLRFLAQTERRGYGHAIYSGREFVGSEPFLHLVGDHLYVSRREQRCAQRLVEVATSERCAVSAVQATRENALPRFGAVSGQPLQGRRDLYKVETVLEKPTPTEAEQHLIVPGLRSGHYLCFFGMHVLTPLVLDVLGEMLAASERVTLSQALSELARRERYLAYLETNRRYDLGERYGLLTAQLALALNGRDRDEVLSTLVELLSQRVMDPATHE